MMSKHGNLNKAVKGQRAEISTVMKKSRLNQSEDGNSGLKTDHLKLYNQRRKIIRKWNNEGVIQYYKIH